VPAVCHTVWQGRRGGGETAPGHTQQADFPAYGCAVPSPRVTIKSLLVAHITRAHRSRSQYSS